MRTAAILNISHTALVGGGKCFASRLGLLGSGFVGDYGEPRERGPDQPLTRAQTHFEPPSGGTCKKHAGRIYLSKILFARYNCTCYTKSPS